MASYSFSIHDFEFTCECTVFDLLDIGLVHGWLCDPQVIKCIHMLISGFLGSYLSEHAQYSP